MTRRSVLRGAGVVGFLGVSAAALELPLFSIAGAQQDPGVCRARDVSSSERRLVISNWPAYIDRAAKGSTNTRQDFTAEYGVEVEYTDDINDNAEFFARVRNQMAACEPIGRDLMMLTDWMAARMIGLGWIQPLDRSRIPNVEANLIEALRGKQWDAENSFHAPWQSGLTGIAYNAAEVEEVGSFSDLLTREDLRGRITLLSEMRDTMGFMLKVVGADPRDFTDDDWGDAIDELRRVVRAGQVRAFTGNEYIQDLTAGNIVACEAWSGDVIQAQFDNPDIKFVVPEEGLSLWSDNMIVPNKATHQANAEDWINYFYEPAVAAKLAAWVNYICPVQGAQEEMEKIAPDLVENELIFPTEESLANTFDFMPLDDQQQTIYEGDWSDVTGG
jgi:spermidine/putrescine transport system substrate-binding protein